MNVNSLAGTPATPAMLIDVAKLIAAYYSEVPDPSAPEQRIAFGTSGHRGSALERTFNESHVRAITQAICLYRKQHRIDGPLFLGIDTHALSVPAFESALEVLAANRVDVLIAQDGEYTPTPAISHAILAFNRARTTSLADGVVVTPSHNPPDSGGFKYNPPHGGPAEAAVTEWIEAKSNALLEGRLQDVRRISFDAARRADTTREHDFVSAYVGDLGNAIDFDAIRSAGVRIGADPLGGAGEILVEIPRGEAPMRGPMLPVSVSERAAKHFAAQLAKHSTSVAVRLAVEPAGCSGFRYRVDAADSMGDDDNVFISGDVRIVVGAASLPYLQGSTIDVVQEGLTRRVRFQNPNARQSCGCGESFGA